MYKIKYILFSEDLPHYRYLHALNRATATDMFLSQYEDTGYAPIVLAVTPLQGSLSPAL